MKKIERYELQAAYYSIAHHSVDSTTGLMDFKRSSFLKMSMMQKFDSSYVFGRTTLLFFIILNWYV